MLRVTLFAFCFVPIFGYAQSDFKKIKSWNAKKTEWISVDRLGNFIFIEKSGRMIKYDGDGKKLATSARQPVTLVEPWFQPTIFVYNRNKQHYNLLDRKFENSSTYAVDSAWAIEPLLVCPTHDNRLWILDQADWSLKKVLPATNQVIHEFNLAPENFEQAEFSYLREYLNLVFLLDKNSGILILNHLGNTIERISAPGIAGFYFFGDEMYFVQNGKLKYFNLITSQWREHPIPVNAVQAIITDERLITLSPSKEATLFKYTLE
ncbi:MAG: hypothetical protein E6Q41_00590 [Cyclobacteriaceae bacterium]|nr:MAG: hypothetical protein E6Q41_00590 [Cyclobacteriaceae bacterium]